MRPVKAFRSVLSKKGREEEKEKAREREKERELEKIKLGRFYTTAKKALTKLKKKQKETHERTNDIKQINTHFHNLTDP